MNDEALEAGRRLFARPCTFVTGAVRVADLPPPAQPEVAFAGRSNVGKSSLLNALTGRRALARTSNTPGRTRQINFFALGEALMLVDLPGYGYARAPKSEVRNWTRLVTDYLRGRPNLRRVCLLIDARHGPKPADEETMTILDGAAVAYQVVLTKCDKAKDTDVAGMIGGIERSMPRHVAAHPLVVATSAVKGTGIPALRAELAALAAPGEIG